MRTIPKPDLILHPVRLRIIQALSGRSLTPQQLAETLSDVPQATLYRHINKLAEGGILAVVAERRVRGTLEKVYSLPEQAASLNVSDMIKISREDNMRYFATYLASLLGYFGRYLQREKIDPAADGIGYRQIALDLNDIELKELAVALNSVVREFSLKKASPGRQRRILATIIIPTENEPISERTMSREINEG